MSPAARTYELSQLLTDVLAVEDVGAYYPRQVAYHPTCHSPRLLGVGDRPMRLLRHVRGIELVALPGAEGRCGFGDAVGPGHIRPICRLLLCAGYRSS